MNRKKRRMMFIPEVNKNSFVFCFEKGDSGLVTESVDVQRPDERDACGSASDKPFDSRQRS